MARGLLKEKPLSSASTLQEKEEDIWCACVRVIGLRSNLWRERGGEGKGVRRWAVITLFSRQMRARLHEKEGILCFGLLVWLCVGGRQWRGWFERVR